MGGDFGGDHFDEESDEDGISENFRFSQKDQQPSVSELERPVLSCTDHFTSSVEVFNLDCEQIREGRSLPIPGEGFTAVVLENEIEKFDNQ